MRHPKDGGLDAMSYSARMKTALERDIKAITLRPSLARSLDRTTITAGSDGLCTVSDGEDSMQVDLGKGHGGNGTTPGPGFLVNAALGACLTQAYLIWAAYLGVQIDRIAVEIHADYDATAGLGLETDASCGYTRVRTTVDVESPAPRADIERVLATAEQCDFMHAIFTEAHPVERELRVSRPEAA